VLKRSAARIKGERRFEVELLLSELATVRARGYAISSYSPDVISTGEYPPSGAAAMGCDAINAPAR
jgi:hypothetical protein